MSKLVLLVLVAIPLVSGQDLSSTQLSMFQDPGGWEYITVSDNDSGIQTQHTCFDGKPHPNQCSGVLVFTPQNKFSQTISIHHQKVVRRGTYTLSGNQLAFFDELGTRDGPYTIAVDPDKKSLTLDMPQVHIQLELHSQYVADRNAKRAPAH